MNVRFVGYGCGLGAGDPGTGDGPLFLKNAGILSQFDHPQLDIDWDSILTPDAKIYGAKKDLLVDINIRLCETVYKLKKNGDFPIVIGGDHSSGIGTWSGMKKFLKDEDFGLIWIDAHMDAHTPQTSETQNIHGMPIACLLGFGDSEFLNIGNFSPKIKPENLTLIGIRSFESGEQELLERLGVTIYTIEDVKRDSFSKIFEKTLAAQKQKTNYFGVSFDLDGLDPSQAPGTGTPVENGLFFEDIRDVFAAQLNPQDQSFLGFEVVEFNPHNDQNGQTQNLLKELLATFLQT